MTTKKRNPNTERKKTPKKFGVAGDNRKEEKAGTYPNYFSYKSRSGHNFVLDDSKGEESVTLQHRGGTAVQMQADGSLIITAHNSQYNVVFGEHRMTISGAQDITVKGDCSLRVYGEYNATVHGNYNMTVMGDYNLTAKNHNRMVRGNIDTQAKNETKKFEGSSAVMAKGAIATVSHGPHTIASRTDQIHVAGSKGLNLSVPNEGDMTFNNEKGNFHFEGKEGEFQAKIKDAIKFLSDSGALHMIAQEAANILSKQGNVNLKAEQGNLAMEASQGDAQMKGQNVKVKGTSSVGVTSDGSTHVDGSDVHVKGTGAVHVDSSSAINLDGGGAQSHSMSELNIGNILSASSLPSFSGSGAQFAEEEPDATQWTSKLV